MAIRQISRITHRKGLSDNLPQLAGAELGWVVDNRKLYIGNGTLAEGAPVVGNTEILTEHTDLLAELENYVYKGEEGGYTAQTGSTVGNPSTRTYQDKVDDFASVKDFGAQGDGTTDDTAAINRALFQLFCRQTNESIRRSLYFPAGVYLVSDTLLIPPFAKLFGEGAESTTIKLSSGATADYVARTTDSLQQIGANIGNQGAVTPQNVEISSMTFKTDASKDCFLIDRLRQASFINVNFMGPLGQDDVDTDVTDIAGLRFDTTTSSPSKHVVFQSCKLSGFTYGVHTNKRVESIIWNNCHFDTLYRGVDLGSVPENGGPFGCKITNSIFDSIYNSGVILGNIDYNALGFNIFNDVGNSNQGSGNPTAVVVDIQSADNISIGDMFERNDTDAATYARIDLNNTASIAYEGGKTANFGTYALDSGVRTTIDNNASDETLFTKSSSQVRAFKMHYTFNRDTFFRHGVLTVVAADSAAGDSSLVYDDDYQENASTGLTLAVSQSSGTITVAYSTTNTGEEGFIEYSLTRLT